MAQQIDKERVLTFWRLSWRLAIAGFKLRNEGSYLGSFWYLLNPILVFLLLFFIFFDRVGGSIQSYPAYLVIGILPFNFFLRATTDAVRIISESGFIKSIKFPQEALVLAIVIKNLFSHTLEATIFFTALFFIGVPFYGILLYIPLLLLMAVFTYGTSLFLSAVSIYIADTGNIWQFLTTLLWFATPIFYAIEGQSRLFILNLFNPPYYFITAARELVVYGNVPEPWILFGAVGYSFISFALGTFVFTRLKHRFAEML